MRSSVLVFFLGGLLAGWAWQTHRGYDHVPTSIAGTQEPSHRELVESSTERWISRGKIDIDPEQLARMLESGESPALSLDDILASKDSSLQLLAQWTGLDAGEKKALASILREAAAQRYAWEAANVTVEVKTPGHWALHFPDDGGLHGQELRQRINDRFGPRKSAAIALAGDIDNFFGFAALQPEFKHGTIEIHARRVDTDAAPDAEGRFLRFQIYVQSGRPWMQLMVSPDASQEMPLGRLTGHLGSAEELVDSITRVTAREQNPFACTE